MLDDAADALFSLTPDIRDVAIGHGQTTVLRMRTSRELLEALAADDQQKRHSAGPVASGAYGLPRHGRRENRSTFIQPTRIRIGTAAWGEPFQEGAALSFVEAIAYALDETSA